MNALVRTYIRNLDQTLDALDQLLAEKAHEAENETRHKEQLLQQYWQKEKERVTLDTSLEQFDRVRAERDALLSREEQLEERLKNVRRLTKALSDVYTP